MEEKKIKKILNGSNEIFAGYGEEYSKSILSIIINNPNINKEELAFYPIKSKSGILLPKISNEYISQKYINYFRKCNEVKEYE